MKNYEGNQLRTFAKCLQLLLLYSYRHGALLDARRRGRSPNATGVSLRTSHVSHAGASPSTRSGSAGVRVPSPHAEETRDTWSALTSGPIRRSSFRLESVAMATAEHRDPPPPIPDPPPLSRRASRWKFLRCSCTWRLSRGNDHYGFSFTESWLFCNASAW